MDSDIDMDSDYQSLSDSDLDNDGYDDYETGGDQGSADDFDTYEPITDANKSAAPSKIPQLDYKVHTGEQLKKQQNSDIEEVEMLLNIGLDASAILLRTFDWNKEKLLERYMDNPDKVLNSVGLSSNEERKPPVIENLEDFCCEICLDDESGSPSFSMPCGHRFCTACFSGYLTHKIRRECDISHLECPQDGCNRIVDSSSIKLLVEPDVYERYLHMVDRTYVELRDKFKWCIAPDCTNAVESSTRRLDLDRLVPTVACKCGQRFCFGCQLEDHRPAPCDLVKKWLKKCADDSETANWISAHTKECPQCNSTIEKNGGCNHMTCRKCRYEFCWMCMGPWNEHGTSWYNCNRYEEKSGTAARDAQAKSRVSLQRYLHYYNRFANHEHSAKLDKEATTRIESKMIQLQASSDLSWVEVQYLKAAADAAQLCRGTLKWTYAFAFFLARNNTTAMFEDNQKDLEMAVEALSELFERPIAHLADPKLRTEIVDKTAYCNKRRVVLLDYAAETLGQGLWTFSMVMDPIEIKTGSAVAAKSVMNSAPATAVSVPDTRASTAP